MENITLKEVQQSFKMIIPTQVEGKIRRALQLFPSTEWSGILFYTYEGTVKDKNLVITCQDFHPMNIGVSTYTQYSEDASIISYMAENDLLDCQCGLVHSHHNFGTTFSQEDLNTLKVDGAEKNNFVSLIVNNAGTYSAKFTTKECCTATVNKVIPFFDTQEESSEDVSMTKVFYYNLDIEIIKEEYSYPELDARFEELKKHAGKWDKNERSLWNAPKNTSDKHFFPADDFISTELPLFGPTMRTKTPKVPKMEEEYKPSIKVNSKLIESTVGQLIMGSLIAMNTPKDASIIEHVSKVLGEKYTLEELDNIIANHVSNVLETNAKHIKVDAEMEMEAISDLAFSCIEEIEALGFKADYIDLIVENLDEYVIY